MGNEKTDDKASRGFLARQHHRLRFTELDETFFGRFILAKCSDPSSTEKTTVCFGLSDLFRRHAKEELHSLLQNKTFAIAEKHSELAADIMSALLGQEIKGSARPTSALRYYEGHIESRLKWLMSGEESEAKPPIIDNYRTRNDQGLISFEVELRPQTLCNGLAQCVSIDLELNAKLLTKIEGFSERPRDTGPRIDYRKQAELITNWLDDRLKATGEVVFSILSSQIPFRWAIQEYPDLQVTIPAVGTSLVQDKILMPLLLELNGLLDIANLDIESDPLTPEDVVVRYSLRRPAKANLFGAVYAGLSTEMRKRLSETELSLYEMLHKRVQSGLVFGGRPKLETSFGDICSWLLRKAAYCLEEPNFIGAPANDWLRLHSDDKRVQMEDQFFLPFLYERLRDEFGGRAVKKPEQFGGEIDILFDNAIPIELKVRRDKVNPLAASEIDEKYKPGGQAAAYAGISRLGIVVVLDLPSKDTASVNLANCVSVVERRFPEDAVYPTCILVITYRSHRQRPSSQI